MADSNAFAYLYANPARRSDRLIVRDLKVYMAPFRHDMAKIVVQGPTDEDWTRWDTGVPLRVQYGRTPSAISNFFGYVLGVDRHWEQTNKLAISDRTMEILAVGASWPFKEGLATAFSGMSSSQIATQIASQNYFDIDAPATDFVWPTKNVSGSSIWEFLCELAKSSGLTCAMNGTQLRFYDPMTILRRNNSVVPVFYEKDSALGQTVLEMQTDVTELSASEGRRKRLRVVQGTDIRTGTDIYVRDDGTHQGTYLARRYRPTLFTEFVSDMVTIDQSSASALLPARTTENRFYIRARAKLAGDVRVVQESPIVIEGLGTRDSGLWQAIEVVHHVHKNWYALDCELGRDSDYDNGVRPGLPAGVARARLDPYETIVFNSPPTALINGRWRAAWTSRQVSGVA